jgi:PAS domain S-box-containing protein
VLPSPPFAVIVAVLATAALTAVLMRRPWRRLSAGSGNAEPVRLLAEHVVDMVSTHDPDGRFRYVSPVLAGLVGEYPGLLVGKDPRELAHPDDAATVDGLWKRAATWRGAAVSISWRCRRHTGEYSWLETTARSASREAAALGAIVCASRDITERKQIEDALRESEQRFRSALETVRLVAVGLDTQGNVTFANDALCALTGWTRSELIGENWFTKCTPPDDPARRVFLETIATGSAPPPAEFEIVCRDSSRRTIAWDATVLRSPAGEVQGTASLGADVTVRRLEDATMQLLQSITLAISAASDLDAALVKTLESLCSATGWSYGEAWLPSDDGERLELASFSAATDVDANRLTVASAGVTFVRGESLPGRTWESRRIEWAEAEGGTASNSPRQQAAANCGFKAAVGIPVLSGSDVVAVMTFFMDRPLHTDDRHTQMVSVVANQAGAMIDRRRAQRRYETDLEAARDAAEAASRAKSDFLSRMSHELRTPLNSVIGFANVMRKNKHKRLAPEELDYLDRITTNGKHLLSLVNDVLDIAKVEAGRLTVSKSMVFVDVLLHEVVSQLQGTTRGAGVDFRAEAPDDMLPVDTDGVLLRQVLINLTGNALRFTQAGSVVLSAEADAEGNATRIHVRDTGIGIPKDRLAAIFEPFEQADETTHQLYGGTGLGLAISKSICDALGFGLTVESQPGKGSSFTIACRPERSEGPRES